MAGKWIEERELQRLASALSSSELSEAQRKAIEKVDARLVLKGSRAATRSSSAKRAKKLARFLKKPFEAATREDLAAYLAHIAENADPEALRRFKSTVRRFYTLLLSPYEERVPKVVSWIKVNRVRAPHPKPKTVFKPDEIKRMLDAAMSQRDRAVMAVLYESGARISELCGLTVGETEFDTYGARIPLDGKTGVRKVLLIQSVPDLRDWLNLHPWKTDPNAPLFVHDIRASQAKPLMQENVRRILRQAAKRAGIEKRANPHAFRRSRATELSQDLTPSELSVLHGWVQGSKMPQVYIHLAAADVEKKLLRRAGLIPEDKAKSNPLQPRDCPRCATQNSANSEYCTKCTLPLDEKKLQKRLRTEEMMEKYLPALLKLVDDPDVGLLIAKKVNEAKAATPESIGSSTPSPAVGSPVRGERPRGMEAGRSSRQGPSHGGS